MKARVKDVCGSHCRVNPLPLLVFLLREEQTVRVEGQQGDFGAGVEPGQAGTAGRNSTADRRSQQTEGESQLASLRGSD